MKKGKFLSIIAVLFCVLSAKGQDVTPPTDAGSNIHTIGVDAFTLQAKISEEGTAYYVLSFDGTKPTVSDVKAGNDFSGTPALQSGLITVPAVTFTADQLITGGLRPATTYYIHLVPSDLAGNDATLVTTLTVTTLPAKITAVTLTENSSCGNGVDFLFNGAVQVETVNYLTTSDYVYTLYNMGTSTIIATSTLPATILTGLKEGTYDLEGFNLVNDIVTERLTVQIVLNPAVPAIAGGDVSILHQTTCNPGGSITITNMSPSLSEYGFIWATDPGMINVIYTGGGVLDNTTYPSIGAGTYYVIAASLVTGCNSPPLRVDILDMSVNPVLVTTPVSNTACIGANGEAQLTIDGLTDPTPYDISWMDISENIIATNTMTASGLSPGTYSVGVMNKTTSCFTSAIFTIGDNIVLPNIAISNNQPNTACNAPNSSVSITVDGGADPVPFTTVWKNFSGTVVANDLFTVTGLLAGSYTVEVTDKSTQCLSSITVVVTDNKVYPTSAILSSIHNTSCLNPNGLVSISVNGGTAMAGHDIVWKNSSGAVIGTNILEMNTLSAGTYKVEVTTVATQCKAPVLSTTLLDNPTPPSAAGITGPTTGCVGTPIDLFVNITGGKAPYTVEIDNGVGVITNYTSGDPISFLAPATTTFNLVKVLDANSCQPDAYTSTIATVKINPLPSPPSAITFSNVTANSFKIAWTNGNGVGRLVVMKEAAVVDMFPANGSGYTANSVFGSGNDLGNSNFIVYNGAGSSVNVTGLKEGVTYHVAIFELNGICYSSALTGSQLTAGCATLPDIAANPASETICNGGTTSIALSSSDVNTTFSWTVVATGVTGAVAGAGSSIAQKLSLTASVAGTAKYTVTPKSGICKGTPITIDVIVEPPPTAFAVTGGGAICEGSGNTVPIGLDGSQAGLNYVLYRGTSTVETVVGTGGALNFSPTDIPGDYSVEVVRSLGCANVMNGSVTVVIDPLPVLSGTILGAATACQGEISRQYSVNDPGGVTYNWTFPAGFSMVSGDGTSTVIVDISSTASSGIVSVTASNSCATTPALTLDVTVNPGFDITIMKADTIYAGKETPFSLETTATLSQVAWNFGDTDLSADIAPVHVYQEPGDYVVTALATADDGCTRNTEISISVGVLASIHIHNVVTPNGDGKNDVLYIENVTFYPGCEVVVLDRWGIKIKSFTDYKNEWDLTTDNGEVLPAGNYLCVVKIPGEKIYSRTITVITE